MADTNRRGEIQRKKKVNTEQPENKRQKTKVSPHLLIITLNVNGLNPPIKRHRVARWKEDPTIRCPQETHLSVKDKQRFKEIGWKMNKQLAAKRKWVKP